MAVTLPTEHATPPRGGPPSWVPSVTTQIFIGLMLGIVVGHFFPAFGVGVKPLADAFLRMIKMIIAPLLFSTLVVGIAGTGDLKAMGRIGLKAIIYFEVATTIALFLGLFLVNFFEPGAGLTVPIGDTADLAALATKQQGAWDIFLHLFPTSVFDAMAKGDILQIVVFATFFGIALAAVGERGRPVLQVNASAVGGIARNRLAAIFFIHLGDPLGVGARLNQCITWVALGPKLLGESPAETVSCILLRQ